MVADKKEKTTQVVQARVQHEPSGFIRSPLTVDFFKCFHDISELLLK
jgi:hypothetical protein